MKIKFLLFAVMGLLCLIAVSAITWNTRYVVHDHQEAKRLVYTNNLAESSLHFTAQLEYERGFTATLLSSKKVLPSDAKKQLSREQKSSDLLYKQFTNELERANDLLDNSMLYQNIALIN